MGDNWASLCLYCFSDSLLNCNLLPPLCALYGFLLYSLASAWQLNWSVLDMCVCLCVWSLLCIQASVYPCMPTWSVRVLLFSCNSSSLCPSVCVCVSKHCWTCNAVLCMLLCPPQKIEKQAQKIMQPANHEPSVSVNAYTNTMHCYVCELCECV